MKKNEIQPQWNESAQAWVDFVRTGKDYYRDELNNPAMFEVLGDISRKKVLDLACGEGYNSRIMAQKGAQVTGVDFSEKMIEYALHKEKEERNGIKYYVADGCRLFMFEDDTFDIVTCFMALQDIENYEDTVREVYRILKKGRRFVFVIPHPCFERRVHNGVEIGGWEYEYDNQGKKGGSPLYFKVDRYFDTHGYIISWDMERLTHHFETTSFHRTLTEYVDALFAAGFQISRLREPQPTKEGLEKYPMELCLRIPQSLLIEAVNC